MAQSINQFGQTLIKGQVDQHLNFNVIECQADAAVSTALIPGQAVKFATTAGGVPKIIAAAAATDDIFGFITYSAKQNSYAAYDYLEIAADYCVLYLEASAAIVRGAKVMYVVSGQKVVTATSGNTIIGRAFDTSTANGDLIRVIVKNEGLMA